MALRIVPRIHRLTHQIGLHLDRLKAPRVTQAEAHVLAHLAAQPHATIGEVHLAFGHKRSTLTSVLDRLEARGLVIRRSDPRDRRTFVLSLTRKGRLAARRVVGHLQAFESRALGSVSAADLRVFLRVLDRIETDED